MIKTKISLVYSSKKGKFSLDKFVIRTNQQQPQQQYQQGYHCIHRGCHCIRQGCHCIDSTRKGRKTVLQCQQKPPLLPQVEFSFEQLDMGNIFIGSKHMYEMVMANKGDIDAIYSVMPNNSIFGPCFAFNPAEGIVMPGGHQAIQVAFSSPYLGDFSEEFVFQVDGSPEKLKVTFRLGEKDGCGVCLEEGGLGCCVCHSMFGDVSFQLISRSRLQSC